MRPRHVVLLTPPESSHPSRLLSRQHNALVSPLAATLMNLPASVANKRLTGKLTPLDATLTKNRGVGYPAMPPQGSNSPCPLCESSALGVYPDRVGASLRYLFLLPEPSTPCSRILTSLHPCFLTSAVHI